MASDDSSSRFAVSPTLDFMRAIWALNHALERTSKRMERELGVTAQQRMVLRLVGRFPNISAGELAGLLRVDPGTLSAALNRMEARRLLSRRRDPDDKRRVLLSLTPQGRKVDRPSTRTLEAAVDRLLERLPTAQGRAMRRTLEDLISELDAANATRPRSAS
jgi:DNA-binding MarR family transcriptional regulator